MTKEHKDILKDMREMKTPMQDILKLESDLTRMFDSDQRVAMALLEHIRNNKKEMLEKEKEVMCEFAKQWFVCFGYKSVEDYYNKTFNTKEV